jgi:hypothetical protein
MTPSDKQAQLVSGSAWRGRTALGRGVKPAGLASATRQERLAQPFFFKRFFFFPVLKSEKVLFANKIA